jgi:hypothetical protein
MGHVSASPRLAAHQSGRAIAVVASKFDISMCGVKYVVALERPGSKRARKSLRVN